MGVSAIKYKYLIYKNKTHSVTSHTKLVHHLVRYVYDTLNNFMFVYSM